MRLLFLFIILACLASCGGSPVSKKLALSDSLVITFNIPDTDSVINLVSTTDKKAIRKLAGFVAGKKKEQGKCGYDGNLVFYYKGAVWVPVVFKYSNAGCRQFLFDMDNKVMSTDMSDEAVNFLKSLAEGKNWY